MDPKVKALAAFLTAFVALLGAFGYAQNWVTPSLIEALASGLLAVIPALIAMIPHK